MIKKEEENIEAVIEQYEQEMQQLELKYDKLVHELLIKRSKVTQDSKENLPDFWLVALSNHRLFKEFIAEQDVQVLKKLKDLRYSKLDDGTVRYLINVLNNI